MAQFGFFLALLFAIVIAIFAVQNTQPVSVTFLFWGPFNTVTAVLVLISAALGAAAMLLLSTAREAGLRWRMRSQGQQLKQAQARIAELEAAQPRPATPIAATEAVVPVTPAPTEAQTAEP